MRMKSQPAKLDQLHAEIKSLENEIVQLVGSEHKKIRNQKSKLKAQIKQRKQYVDAELVINGRASKQGNFTNAEKQ